MGSLCWPCGFMALVKKDCFDPVKGASQSNPGDGFSAAMPILLKSQTPICVVYQNPVSRASRSSTFLSCARDSSAVVETSKPNSSEVARPYYRPAAPTPQTVEPQEAHSWNALEIAEAVDGEIIRWGVAGTISTDTRKLMPGQWFFPIAGESCDGHVYVDRALADKGCTGVVGNNVCEDWRKGFIRVEGDTLIALEKMARYARDRFCGVVVGLTGSVGKTTTRNMVALALESFGLAYQTHGNLNSKVGVALTLIGIPMIADVSVVELAMGGREGEILDLAHMCRPSVRVILNVGHCHMDYFRSLEEVARAKGELFKEAKPGDICVVNADDPFVMSIPIPPGVKKILFGRRIGCDVRLVSAESVDGGCAVHVRLESQVHRYLNMFPTSGKKTSDIVEFKIHGPGLHLAMNACAAAAVALSLGVPLRQIGESLSRFRPVHMRSEMELTRNNMRIINDTYNASFSSTVAAIKSLEAMDCRGKRVAILGDMLELGSIEEEAHETVLKLCYEAGFDLVMLAGKRFLAAVKKLRLEGGTKLICALDSATLVPRITEMLTDHDVVLVKGSRAMQMEKVVDIIKMINA